MVVDVIKVYYGSHLNKIHYLKIKTYNFYRKDIWGLLKWKRLYKFKKLIYGFMRLKRKFYYAILYHVYKGIQFFFKKYNYKTNLLFTKKRLKFFYNFFSDTYVGKLGKLVTRKNNYTFVDYFFSLFERRLDILVYRGLYFNTIRNTRFFFFKKYVLVNNSFINISPNKIINYGDYVSILNKPLNYFFFQYFYKKKDMMLLSYRTYLFHLIKRRFLSWKNFYIKKNKFILYYFFFSKHRRFGKKIRRSSRFGNFFVFFRKTRNRNEKIQKFLLNYKIFFLKPIYIAIWRVFKLAVFCIKSNVAKLVDKNRYYLTLDRYRKFSKFKYMRGYRFYGHLRSLKFFFRKKISRFYKKIVRILKKIRFYYYLVNKYCLSIFKVKRVYGLVNLRIRFKRFFFLLLPKYYKRLNIKYFFGNQLLLWNKNFRVWKFSKFVYQYFKKLKIFFYIFAGYNSFLEVNYKINIFLLISYPSLESVYYPFNFDKYMFFNYFKMRGYF